MLILIKLALIFAFSYLILYHYRKEYSRGYCEGVKATNTTALPSGCVNIILELPPHLHSKLVAHLAQFQLNQYLNDECSFIIKEQDIKVFADFAYKHSLGISIIK